MISNTDLQRMLRGIVLGGLLACAAFFSGILTVVIFTDINSFSRWEIILAPATFGASLLATLWATGFWGRWGLLLFFAALPLVIVVDFEINPLFPTGTILLGIICYKLTGNRQHQV